MVHHFWGCARLSLKVMVVRTRFSFYHAIAEARLEVIKNVPDLIAHEVKALLETQSAVEEVSQASTEQQA